jgi:membrane fusion protein (multidrug efflux system)
MKVRRTNLVAAVLIIASLAPCAAKRSQADPSTPATVESPPVIAPVVVRKAVETTMERQVRGYGMVDADPNAVFSVNAPFAASVGQVFVRAGEWVTKGQKLVTLETAPAEAAAFAQAKAAVSYAQGELAREQTLFRQQLATRAQVAQAQNALNDAEAKLRALQSIGAGRQRTVITASAAGLVSAVLVKAGQRLAEGANMLTLAPKSALVVRLGVEPERADAVRQGMAAQLRDALDPAETRTGTVMSVSAMVDPTTRLRDVLVRLDPQPSSVDPPIATGAFFQGTIVLGHEQVIAVPREAILLDNNGNYLFVVRQGKAHRVSVKTGPETAGLVAVTGAVQAGDEVVIQGNYELSDGMDVRVVTQ